MRERDIYVTDLDRDRLRNLLRGARLWSSRDRAFLEDLEAELERAHVVPAAEIPADVVTMHSEIGVRDLDSGREMVFTLVFPSESDPEQRRISILAPVGTAVLGYRAGDTIEWRVPGGVRRFRIERVLYQPEAAGDYHR
jgi:regulator of nucleoside diphosphate kinase